jgi:hypothetical protein
MVYDQSIQRRVYNVGFLSIFHYLPRSVHSIVLKLPQVSHLNQNSAPAAIQALYLFLC